MRLAGRAVVGMRDLGGPSGALGTPGSGRVCGSPRPSFAQHTRTTGVLHITERVAQDATVSCALCAARAAACRWTALRMTGGPGAAPRPARPHRAGGEAD